MEILYCAGVEQACNSGISRNSMTSLWGRMIHTSFSIKLVLSGNNNYRSSVGEHFLKDEPLVVVMQKGGNLILFQRAR